jgi:two-component system, LytTR family, response regulator
VKIRTLIIDDEPLARKRVKQLLASAEEFQVIGEAKNVAEAVSACQELRPDLVFLDVEMPDGSGFDALEKLSAENMPAVVFVTAYDQFTIKAFDVYAVDYLLKPFSEERFHQAAARVRERLSRASDDNLNQQMRNLLSLLKTNRDFLDRLVINHKDRLVVISVKEVDSVVAYGNYLKVHAGGKTYLLRETINNLSQRLDPEIFLRIHRSTIVNAERIKEFQPMFGGQYAVILKDGSEFVLSRNYRKEVLSRFE